MKFTQVVCVLAACLLVQNAQAEEGDAVGGEIKFHGTVAARTCALAPGNDNIEVDLQQLATRDLYSQKKSTPVPFAIHLTDCSQATFNSVSVTFSGTVNPKLANHLAISPKAPFNTSGIGVGFTDKSGSEVMLNQATTTTIIEGNDMMLEFNAYVEGEPDALQNHTVEPGAFTATANYTLNYQ